MESKAFLNKELLFVDQLSVRVYIFIITSRAWVKANNLFFSLIFDGILIISFCGIIWLPSGRRKNVFISLVP